MADIRSFFGGGGGGTAKKAAAPPPESLTRKRRSKAAASSPATPAAAIVVDDEASPAPSAGPTGSSDSPILLSPPPRTPVPPVKCELDTMYSALPKAALFMSTKEKVEVRSAKMERDFLESIEAEKMERRRLIQSFEESGKTIHPFLQPKAIVVKPERKPDAHQAGSGGLHATKDRSQFARVDFPKGTCAPDFPPDYSNVPIDFRLAEQQHPKEQQQQEESRRRSALEFGPRWAGLLHVMTQEEMAKLAHPLPIDQRHYTMLTVGQLYTLLQPPAASSAAASMQLSPSLPLWARPHSFPVVDYLTAPAFRSADVTAYLGQPRAQAFLKGAHEKLQARMEAAGAGAGATWSAEQMLKLVRRLMIRRVHCFRASQRDEQLRRQRAVGDSAAASSSSSTPGATSTSASSRSDRAASRSIKADVTEHTAHQDEKISHAFTPRADSLWTEQYKALTSDEMFGGNVAQRAQVKEWLRAWSLRQEGGETTTTTTTAAAAAPASKPPPTAAGKKRRRRYKIWSDESDFDEWETPSTVAPSPSAAGPLSPVDLSTTLLLVGPPVGKSSLVYACCHESETGVIEISNSDRRAKHDVLSRCEEATQSHRLAMVTGGAAANQMATNMAMASRLHLQATGHSPGKVHKRKAEATPIVGTSSSSTAAGNKAKAPTKAPSFGFFDSAAKKKEALAAAAAAAAAAAEKEKAEKAAKEKAAASAAPMSKREARKAALVASKAKSIQVAVKGMPEELLSSESESNDDDEEEEDGEDGEFGAGGRKKKKKKQQSKNNNNNNNNKRKTVAGGGAASASPTAVDAGDFFANQAAFKKAKLNTGAAATTGASSSGAAAAALIDPLAPVSAMSSQSLITFEEVDNVFAAHDKKFLQAVRTLIANAKRPIVLTCNRITNEMEEALSLQSQGRGADSSFGLLQSAPLIETVRFVEPTTSDVLPFVYAICLVEVGFHSGEAQANLPTVEEVEALLRFFHHDVRRTLLCLQVRLNALPLAQMLGHENLLATLNASAATWATQQRKRVAQLRLYPSGQSSHQDLILANLGLLNRKEELMTAFGWQPPTPTAVATTKAAAAAAAVTPETHAAALYLGQTATLASARAQDLPLVHLNYLATFVRALLAAKAPAPPAADTDETMPGAEPTTTAATSHGLWFHRLPVRLSALPQTAEQMFPLHTIRLTPEMLAIRPTMMMEPTNRASSDITSLGVSPIESTPNGRSSPNSSSSGGGVGAAPTTAPPSIPLAAENVAAADWAMVDAAAPQAATAATAPASIDVSASTVPVAVEASAQPMDLATTTVETPHVVDRTPVDLTASSPDVSPADVAMSDDESDSEKVNNGGGGGSGSGNMRKKKRISLEEGESGEDAEMGQVDLSADESADAPGGDDAGEADAESENEVQATGVGKYRTKAQRRAAEAADREATRRLAQATNALRNAQRRALQDQLIASEEQKRAAALSQKRARAASLAAQDPCLAMLDGMAAAADAISAIDVYTQPCDPFDMTALRLLSRSHSRYHPAIHAEVTSASRDFFPIYLEALIPSSPWLSLEQQAQDAVEMDCDAAEREARLGPVDVAKQLTLSLGKESDRRRQMAPEEEWEVPDRIRPTYDTSREMASVAEVHAMRALQTAAAEATLPGSISGGGASASHAPIVLAADVPVEAFPSPAPADPSTTTTPPATASQPIVIDSQPSDGSDTPAPPAAPEVVPSPPLLLLPSVDLIPSSDSLAFRVYRSPSGGTSIEYRQRQSELAWDLWDKLDCQQHAFGSVAFLCDVFPHLRSLIFDALDHTPALASSAAAASLAAAPAGTENDAMIAAALGSSEHGRASRRSTRAARASATAPKLNRRWQHLSHALSKSTEIVQTLQQSAWRDVKNRPLQPTSVWQPLTLQEL